MKGIIAETHGSHMIVIAKNGDFIKCKKLPNCNIGDEVNIPTRNMNSIYKKISTIAASFIILAMLSTGVYAYYTPYSYVSVDINPSLELYVNRFDRVIEVHAFNEDAEKLLDSSVNIKNKGIDTALEQIIDRAVDKGYLKENAENSVMIVVSSNSKKEETALTNKISKSSTTALAKVSSSYEVILEKTKVENYKKAKEGNISPGKVILANQFKEVKPEIDEEKIKHMPLQQAIQEIEKKDEKAEMPEKPKKPSTTAIIEKPNSKSEQKGNVMNVKELIKEKNEELGKKLEQDNNKDKDKEKNKKDKESFNQDSEDSDKKEDSENQNKNEKKETDKNNSYDDNEEASSDNGVDDDSKDKEEKSQKDDKKKD